MTDYVVQAEHVSKKFCRTLRRGMIYTGLDLARDFVGVASPSGTLRTGEFWAVDDVSFRVRRGESLGIIGRNGSGKTTILNLLNGVLMPDRGQIEIQGRVGALTEIGAGFHPMLTGRENIAVNGLMLSMTGEEIKNNMAEIIAFAEIGDFIDMPVKNYSSGMYLRLGFSIAIHASVDILLVDEVLAVGDLAFATKCLRKIVDFRKQGGAVILVSHAMHNVRFVCDRALWINSGVVQGMGPSVDVVNVYEEHMLSETDRSGEVIAHDDKVSIAEFKFAPSLEAGERLVIDTELHFNRRVNRPIFLLHLHSTIDDSLVFSHYSHLEGYNWDYLEGRVLLRMTSAPLVLRAGCYRITFSISEGDLNRHLVWHYKRYAVTVRNNREVYGTLDAAIRYELIDG